MIGFLRGKILDISLNSIILDVNGVGYTIKLKIDSLKLIVGEQCELYIYHHIREDRQELYGFLSKSDQDIFELLLSVSGVGPKVAMTIVSAIPTNKIKDAIIKSDSSIFQGVPGVGKKVALKILVELKNKLDSTNTFEINLNDGSSEVLDAMESLGYKKQEISPLLSKIPEKLASTQEKIKWLLKEFKK